MDRNDFLRMIKDPSLINRQMMGEIGELIEIFPYFQSARLLLLKGLHDTSDVKFNNQLRKSAIYIGDREVLYYLLKTEPESRAEAGKGNQDSVKAKNDFPDNQQTVIESAKSSEGLIKESDKISPTGLNGNGINDDKPDSGHPILVPTESENDESASVIFIKDEEPGPAEDKVFYMDPGILIPDQPDLLELESEDKNIQKSGMDLKMQDYLAREGRDVRKKQQADLIDKFIIANPRIEPVREKPNQPPDDISKSVVEEQGVFVTETLARIYVNQGYYSKAIDIYEKLCLKFPEKSSYFASQIEKVQELIKK